MSAQERKAEMWLSFSVCACKTVGTTFLKRPPKPLVYTHGLSERFKSGTWSLLEGTE